MQYKKLHGTITMQHPQHLFLKTCSKRFLQQTTHRLQYTVIIFTSALDATEVCFVMHMVIVLQSVCCLLQEILAKCYRKMSGVNMISSSILTTSHKLRNTIKYDIQMSGMELKLCLKCTEQYLRHLMEFFLYYPKIAEL